MTDKDTKRSILSSAARSNLVPVLIVVASVGIIAAVVFTDHPVVPRAISQPQVQEPVQPAPVPQQPVIPSTDPGERRMTPTEACDILADAMCTKLIECGAYGSDYDCHSELDGDGFCRDLGDATTEGIIDCAIQTMHIDCKHPTIPPACDALK